MSLNLSFEQYLLLSEESKKELEKSLTKNLNKLESFQKKEYEIKLKESLNQAEKSMLETYSKSHTHLSIYEGFSIHNYKNIIHPSFKHNQGFIIFLSENELSPIEEYGLVSLFYNCFNQYENFNINANIYKGIYKKDKDKVSEIPNENNLELKHLDLLCLSHLNRYNINLKNNMIAYYLHYTSEPIQNNSSLLKKKVKRKFNCENNFIIE